MPASIPVYFDLADTVDETFDRPIEWMLIGLLAFGPLALGAVQPWSEAVFCALAYAMAILVAFKLFRRPEIRFVRSWTYWPIAIFLLFAIAQFLPLPAAIVRLISPSTLSTKTRLLGDGVATFQLSKLALSFYPEAGWHDVRLLTAIVCVFVTTLNVVRRRDRIRRLLAAIAIIGGAIAVLSLIQDVTGTTDIYWSIPDPSGHAARSGPFINHSHFGQWMNWSIGAAAGLLLDFLNRVFRRADYTPEEVITKLRDRSTRPAWLLLAMIILGAAAIALSLSRGALLGMACGGAGLGLLLSTRRGMAGKLWILSSIVIAVAVIALLDSTTLLQRFAGESAQNLQGNRLEILRDLLPAWKLFPIFGTGLGTHSVIFPMFDRSDFPFFASHAENEYAQVLTETGALGLVCVVVFVCVISAAIISAVRGRLGNVPQGTGRASPASAMAMGLAFGWIAILVQSVSDFGQHMPAVAALTAVCAALSLNLRALRRTERGEDPPAVPGAPGRHGQPRVVARGVAVLGLIVICCALLWQSSKCTRADDSWQAVRRIDGDLQKLNWLADNAEYYDIIQAADNAARLRPHNALYRYWLNFYRWKSLTRARDARGAIVLPASSLPFVQQIDDELLAARWDCPTYGPIDLLAGQLERSYLPSRASDAAVHLREAYELSGPDPAAAFVAGEVAAAAGRFDESIQLLHRAIQLNADYVAPAVDVFLVQLNRPDLAMQAAGDSVDALETLAKKLEDRPADRAVAADARTRAFELKRQHAEASGASIDELAAFAAALVARHDDAGALRFFQRALSLDFARDDLRLDYADALLRLGRKSDASREAKRVLRRSPRQPHAMSIVNACDPVG